VYNKLLYSIVTAMNITPVIPVTAIKSDERCFFINSLTPIITDNHESRQVLVKFFGLPMTKYLVIWDSRNYSFKDLSDEGIKSAVLSALGPDPGETISKLCL